MRCVRCVRRGPMDADLLRFIRRLTKSQSRPNVAGITPQATYQRSVMENKKVNNKQISHNCGINIQNGLSMVFLFYSSRAISHRTTQSAKMAKSRVSISLKNLYAGLSSERFVLFNLLFIYIFNFMHKLQWQT